MLPRLDYNFYERIKPRLHRRVGRELQRARRVLDLGCGCCDLVQYLADVYGQDVTGVDISSGSFPGGRQTDGGITYRCRKCDAANLYFAADASADAVVIMWALHEMVDPAATLREVLRVLQYGGELFILEFPRDSLAADLWGEDYFEVGEIAALLREAGYAHVQSRRIEHGQVMWARGFRPGPTDRWTAGIASSPRWKGCAEGRGARHTPDSVSQEVEG